ncbi:MULTISPECIES: S1 domain-containing RNA-binding protein [Enterococcus]|uniref:S1 RNA-binding protein n=1 Tax=Enterococcus sulfureus ATCC 49903 TaxID=1140003 RepID=S0NRU8_9ENTE|nr:S1 domain-containing RNA-binding protein [Enterococcus sulfureus]EOT45345.1 S1 RNA-binding protein [Enterococcus sulfureus ATCC 49903]EOT84202.1 S1 RNA-binding protein [Enterococcus sulfureus ATCC 49903]
MSIEVGAKVPGKVSGITNFGAFIDLGAGKTGLVHISEVSNGFVKDINEVLKVGDEVTVLVTNIGTDGKIGLSIRKAEDKPREEKREYPKKEFNRGPKKPFTRNQPSQAPANTKQDFDSLMSSFLKDSDDRLSSLKRNTEGKRGGRGGRRN